MLIEAVNLRKHYGRIKAVDGIDLEVREGEILGILGPNGAGKSTTISMISTLIKPDEGKIMFRGRNIVDDPRVIRNILGMVPQDVALYPDLSALENLRFFGRLYGLKGSELDKRIKEVLDILGLNGRAGDSIKKYSGGMKRRVNIGAALLHHPRILVMDEPTVGIDPQSRKHILETVKGLNARGMTIIYTSHYMEEVEALCDRIYIMDYGRIIASGTGEQLKRLIDKDDTVEIQVDKATDQFIRQLKGNVKVKHVDVRGNNIILISSGGSSILPDVFETAVGNDVKMLSVQVKTPTLEDVFLHLTGRGLRD